MCCVCFFFFKQKTAYEMRISDWSSTCALPISSRMTMIGTGKQSITQVAAVAAVRPLTRVTVWSPTAVNREALAEKIEAKLGVEAIEIGRASCRERVCQYV